MSDPWHDSEATEAAPLQSAEPIAEPTAERNDVQAGGFAEMLDAMHLRHLLIVMEQEYERACRQGRAVAEFSDAVLDELTRMREERDALLAEHEEWKSVAALVLEALVNTHEHAEEVLRGES